jgi:hypothetical protein
MIQYTVLCQDLSEKKFTCVEYANYELVGVQTFSNKIMEFHLMYRNRCESKKIQRYGASRKGGGCLLRAADETKGRLYDR